MGTHFQRLTASRAWGPEAVQAESARNLEAHHVVSQARLQLPRGLGRPPRPREEQHMWPWQPKTDPGRHRPLCPQLRPSGRPLPWCVFGAGGLMGPNPNTNRTTNQDLPPKVKPALKPNPAIEHPPLRGCHLPWLIMADPLRTSSPGTARLGPPHPGLSLTMAHHA